MRVRRQRRLEKRSLKKANPKEWVQGKILKRQERRKKRRERLIIIDNLISFVKVLPFPFITKLLLVIRFLLRLGVI